MRVYCDGYLTHQDKKKRTVRSGADGDYVFIYRRRHPVKWVRGRAVVDVDRTKGIRSN